MKKQVIKKISAVTLTAAMLIAGETVSGIGGIQSFAAEKTAADYQYSIKPLLAPFNNYFFVKTDNPDPQSFRFSDKSSIYNEDSTIGQYSTAFPDVHYENNDTLRVNGGYIFRSGSTDGGQITLQYKEKSKYWWEKDKWVDTDLSYKLPTLKDSVDYLIDTYASGKDFFEKMDSVQSGLSSICLYSSSYIRGEIVKSREYWMAFPSPYADQGYYINSPYSRKDNKFLFPSEVYPYILDSYFFPLEMKKIAKKLDPTVEIKWDDYNHYLINVTKDGTTKKYGGAGKVHGKGIDESKIKQYFTFGDNGTKITLDSIKKLMEEYSKVQMDDDVPREGALTWKDIWERVGKKTGDGSWVRGADNTYSYLYRYNDTGSLSSSEFGTGHSQYYSGDLGMASDAWVDGRYIDNKKCFVPGEKFSDHPESKIMIRNFTLPLVSYKREYKYNSNAKKYEYVYSNVSVKMEKKDVMFYNGWKYHTWTPGDMAFKNYAHIDIMKALVEQGLLDQKYVDMVTLTKEEVEATRPDRKTNIYPKTILLYDGTAQPGTQFTPVSINSKAVNVKFDSLRFTYDGKFKFPDVTVTVNGQLLEENKDYDIDYSEFLSEDVGEYTISVIGIGKYSGIITKTYHIFEPAESVTLSKTSASVDVGKKITLKASVQPAAAADSIIWKSSDKRIATVSNGVVKGISNGVVTITAEASNGIKASCRVKVGKLLTNCSTISSASVRVGTRVTLNAAADGGNGPYTYALMFRKAGSDTWTKIGKKYGTASTASFKPGKAVPYEVMINVKDSTGKIKSKTFTVNVTK